MSSSIRPMGGRKGKKVNAASLLLFLLLSMLLSLLFLVVVLALSTPPGQVSFSSVGNNSNISGIVMLNATVSYTGSGPYDGITNLSFIFNRGTGGTDIWAFNLTNATVNASGWAEGASPNLNTIFWNISRFNTASLPDGLYNITINISNSTETASSRNDSSNSKVFNVTIDNTPPPINAFWMNYTNNSNLTAVKIEFNATSNDTTSYTQAVRFSLQNGNATGFNVTASRNFTAFVGVVDTALMADGRYTVQVFSNDSLGNSNNSVANITFTTDETSPSIHFFTMNITNGSNITGTQTIRLNGSANDTTTFTRDMLFSFATPGGVFPFNITGLANPAQGVFSGTYGLSPAATLDGMHVITIIANDSLGNMNNSINNLSFTYDATPPPINAFWMNYTNGSNFSSAKIEFNVTSNDTTTSTQEVRVSFSTANATGFNVTATRNASAFVAVVDTVLMSEGFYTAIAIANDSLGNQGNASNISFTVDKTPPAIGFFSINVSNNSNFSGTVSIQVNASANDSVTYAGYLRFSFSFPAGGPANPFNLSGQRENSYFFVAYQTTPAGTTEGLHTITVIANDSAGNFNNSVSNISFTYDNSPPNVSVVSLNNFTDYFNLSPGLSADFMSLNATANDSITAVQTLIFEINSTNGTRFNVTASRFAARWNATINLSLLTESVHSARVYASDFAGNFNSSQYITFLVNRTNQVDAGAGGGTGGGGGSGGGGGGGGAGTAITAPEVECTADRDCADDEVCRSNECRRAECTRHNDCREKYYCVQNECTRVFDLKIQSIEARQGEISFSYYAKNIIHEKGDVTIHSTVTDARGDLIAEGADVIFMATQEVQEKATLYVSDSLPVGTYTLTVELIFGEYRVNSYRTFVVEREIPAPLPAEGKAAPSAAPALFGQAIGITSAVGRYWMYVLFSLIALVLLLAVAKKKRQQTPLKQLEGWMRTNLRRGYSLEKLRESLHESEYSELDIHLAGERIAAERQLQEKYVLKEKELQDLRLFVHQQAKLNVPLKEAVLALSQKGWDLKLAEEYVTAHYVGQEAAR